MAAPDLDRQRQFYDQYWQGQKPIGRYKQQRVQWIVQQLKEIGRHLTGNRLKLLDIGCGDGQLTPFWQQITGAETHGIELSPKAVEAAQATFPSVSYVSGDATTTPYADGMFNIVICQEVLEHIEHQESLLTEISRILKQGGYLLLTTPNKLYFDNRKGGNYSQQPIENIINRQQLLNLLNRHFVVRQYETLIYAQGDYGIYRVFTNRYWLALLRKMLLENTWKNLLLKKGYGLHMAVVCVKR